MNEDWVAPEDDEPALHHIAGRPKPDEDGHLSRRDVLAFAGIRELLKQKISEGGELCENWVRAKVELESNSARKVGEEAAENAARREELEANADVKRQEAANQFIANMEALKDLPPLEKSLALAKVVEANPDIADQLDKVEYMVQRLRYERGARVEVVDPALLTELPQSKAEASE